MTVKVFSKYINNSGHRNPHEVPILSPHMTPHIWSVLVCSKVNILLMLWLNLILKDFKCKESWSMAEMKDLLDSCNGENQNNRTLFYWEWNYAHHGPCGPVPWKSWQEANWNEWWQSTSTPAVGIYKKGRMPSEGSSFHFWCLPSHFKNTLCSQNAYKTSRGYIFSLV